MTQRTKDLYIITGSSKGLGGAIVKLLVKNPNNQVVGIARTAVPSQINYRHFAIDLSNTRALVDALQEIMPEGEYNRIVLINNAGWIGEIGPMGKLDPFGIEAIHAINIVAPAILMDAFVNKFKNVNAVKIVINISSGAARKATDGWSGYCASKAALNQMTLVAAEESKLHGYGIKYFALSPGIIDTPMQETIREASADNFSQIKKFRAFKSDNQLSTPEETAKKVMLLIEKEDTYQEVLQDVREF
jgi:benzil reductase ((S)-benzoin forming)